MYIKTGMTFVQIVGYGFSKLKDKRFVVQLNNNKLYHFGYKFGATFLDHKNERKKDGYIKRHLGNQIERRRIEHFIPSPALFSFYLLWSSSDLIENIKNLNQLFIRHKILV